jgi:hypothetical protein
VIRNSVVQSFDRLVDNFNFGIDPRRCE